MKSEYLQTLVESVAVGSFSKAAENLFITQSAVSRRIKFMEDQYGYSLIDRSGPILVATDVGRIVIEKAEKILKLENELQNNLRMFSPKSGITFCCSPSFGITYLPEIMKDFMILKPDMLEMKFSFETPDNVVDGMRKGLYHVSVIEHNQDYDLDEFETFELPGDEVLFISSPKLGLTEDELSLERLEAFDLYTRKEGCCSSKLLDYNIKKQGKEHSDFNRVIYFDDLHLIISSVLSGYGLAFLSMSVVRPLVNEGVLRTHRATGFEHAYKRTLIVNKVSASTKLLNNFIEEIRRVFKKASTLIETSSCFAAAFFTPLALDIISFD